MSNLPLISVVMSVYNGEKYLSEAIESILNQTYTNFEFIIVNDGSSDKSIDIIKEYMTKDNRIVLIDRENKGLPYSLNEGISKAKGEYIARMDADDISLPERFKKQLEYMKENKLDVCGTFIEVFGTKRNNHTVKYSINHNDIKFRLMFMSAFAHPTVLLKKEVFKKVKYRVDYKVAQDYQLWVDIINVGYKVGNIPKVLLKYREHEAQASIEKAKRQQDTAHRIALEYTKILGEKEFFIESKIIESKKNISLKEFKSLLTEINGLGKKEKISNQTMVEILKHTYNFVGDKNPMMYFSYRKATINYEKDLKEEFTLFIKSFVFVNRESGVYQFLKRIKKMMKI